MVRIPSSSWSCFLAFLLPIFFFFYGLGSYGLLNNNEGLYGEIARELLLSPSLQDWIIPKLNGVPYIEKPPLLYWFTALSFFLFGETEWAARFFPALSGLLTTIISSIFIIKLKQKKLFLPTVIFLSSSLGYIIVARTVYFEGLLIFFLTASLLSFYLGYTQGQKNYIRLFYIFMGFAFLTKGLVGPALVILILGIFALLDKAHWKNLSLLWDAWGLFFGASISFPWILLAAWYDPGFLWFFFINEHFLRFLDLKKERDYYRGPWWYYLPRVLGYVFPWAPFFLNAPFFSNKKDPFLLFLKVWIIVPLLFYSFSRAKANYYMLISIVPLCILLACSFLSLYHKKTLTSFIILLLHLFGLGLLGVGLFYEKSLFSCAFIIPRVLVAFFGAVLLYFLQKNVSDVFSNPYKSYRFLLPSGVFYMILLCVLGAGGIDKISREKPALSMKYAWQEINSSLKDKPASLYIFRHYEELSSLLWYAKRVIPIIDYEGGDLLYGKSKNLPKPQNPFVSSQEVKLSPSDLIFMHKKALPLYKETPLFSQTQEVYQKGDIVVFQPK